MKTSLLIAVALLPLATGCVAAAAAGAVGGIVLSQEYVDNSTYVAHLNSDVNTVWPTAKRVISDTSLELVETDEAIRVVKGKIDGSTVTVNVEPYDIDKSILKVKARNRFGLADQTTAELVMERIVRRVQN